MIIKTYLALLVEKIAGRKCTRCLHNCGGKCYHTDEMYAKCWSSLTKPGFEQRPPRYLKDKTGRRPDGFKGPMEVKPAPLTAEQQHQLAKIKAVLQEAEDTARESGLVSED